MKKIVLHAGCGDKAIKLPRDYAAYKEVRLDLSAENEPDIVGSIVAMPQVESGFYDAVYCSHCIEHLYYHESILAMREFHRVLKPEGILEIQTPDLQGIGSRIALDEVDTPLYGTPYGEVAVLDMLFGMRSAVAMGKIEMAHKIGFTSSSIKKALYRAGFEKVSVERIAGIAPALKVLAIKDKAEASNGEQMSTSAAEASYAKAV